MCIDFWHNRIWPHDTSFVLILFREMTSIFGGLLHLYPVFPLNPICYSRYFKGKKKETTQGTSAVTTSLLYMNGCTNDLFKIITYSIHFIKIDREYIILKHVAILPVLLVISYAVKSSGASDWIPGNIYLRNGCKGLVVPSKTNMSSWNLTLMQGFTNNVIKMSWL